VRVEGDDIEIEGGARLTGAVTETHDDHRLAMTFAIAGLIAGGETIVRRPGSAAISYPGFFQQLEGVRA
jgi:3-phosphoshikimate 1-carboxyvinyltransferase